MGRPKPRKLKIPPYVVPRSPRYRVAEKKGGRWRVLPPPPTQRSTSSGRRSTVRRFRESRLPVRDDAGQFLIGQRRAKRAAKRGELAPMRAAAARARRELRKARRAQLGLFGR